MKLAMEKLHARKQNITPKDHCSIKRGFEGCNVRMLNSPIARQCSALIRHKADGNGLLFGRLNFVGQVVGIMIYCAGFQPNASAVNALR